MNAAQGQPQFDGDTYDPHFDYKRLKSQLERVKAIMRDGHWRTLDEICQKSGGTQAAVSARLRDLRKEKFGGHAVERRARASRESGLFEYRLVIEPEQRQLL
jgi:hypothetical protein